MNIKELLASISDRVQSSASVTAVYGEPFVAEGKTIIPVARVRYGFGGGGGTQIVQPATEEGDAHPQTGGGGAGGVDVSPIGFIEVTPDETRYVSFETRKRIIRAAVFALLLAFILLRRRRRR